MDIGEQIHTYIVENFLLGDEHGLSASESLLKSGVVDSTGVIELVGFLEETYEIEVADEDMVPENLDTIANIAAYVQRRRSPREAGTATVE